MHFFHVSVSFFVRPSTIYSECLDTSSFILLNVGHCRDKSFQFTRSCWVERTHDSRNFVQLHYQLSKIHINTRAAFPKNFAIDLKPIENNCRLVSYLPWFIQCSFVHFAMSALSATRSYPEQRWTLLKRRDGFLDFWWLNDEFHRGRFQRSGNSQDSLFSTLRPY